MKIYFFYIISCFISTKITSAQVIKGRHRGQLSPGLHSEPKPTLASPSPSLYDRAPKCYPETATAYFLPAPPSAPKVTILDPNWKDTSYNHNFPEIIANLQPNIVYNRVNLEPPCNPSSMLPDLIDDVPLLLQNRFIRLADSDDKGCESCTQLIEKLPIFNFDKELLDGFLAGLGIKA